MRIGIGRPLPGWTVVKHVLAPFPADDAPKIQEAISYLLPAVECIVTDGIDMAMNRYNPRKKKAAKQEAHEKENAEKGSAVPQTERQEGEA